MRVKYKTFGKFLNLLLLIFFVTGCSLGGQNNPTGGPAGATNTPVEGAGLCANPYYPVLQGATWTYKTKGGAAGDYSYTDTITAVREDGFTLTSQFDKLTVTQAWQCKDEGLVALELDGPTVATLGSQDINVALSVKNVTGTTVPSEIDPGDQWQHALEFEGTMVIAGQTAQADGNIQSNFTALGNESVSVPAGTFNALKLHVDTALTMSIKI